MHRCTVRAGCGMRTCIPAQLGLCMPWSQWGGREPYTGYRGHGRGVSELRAARMGVASANSALLDMSSEDLYRGPEDGMKVRAELVTQHVEKA